MERARPRIVHGHATLGTVGHVAGHEREAEHLRGGQEQSIDHRERAPGSVSTAGELAPCDGDGSVHGEQPPKELARYFKMCPLAELRAMRAQGERRDALFEFAAPMKAKKIKLVSLTTKK